MPIVQSKHQIFGAPPDVHDAASFEPISQVLWKGNAQARPVLADFHYQLTFERGSKTARDGFNFG
jgi:hypothetical protein